MEKELVRRAKNGEHVAFESLVRPQIEGLYGLGGLLLADRSRAEDAVQEALLKAWRDLPSLRDPEKFGPWLRRLLVNAAYDEWRKLGRRREVELKPEHDRTIVGELDGLLNRDELARALRQLSKEERTVVALRYYRDLSTADAAATLGIREVTYRSKLHRAIRKLGAALAGLRTSPPVSQQKNLLEQGTAANRATGG